MKLLLIKAKYKCKFSIPKNFLKYVEKNFKKNSTLAIYSAVQFSYLSNKIKNILEKKDYKILFSKPDRTSQFGQILGCDSYKNSLNLNLEKIDGFIYLGDGYFHPQALLFAQEKKENFIDVLCINFPEDRIEILKATMLKKNFLKKKANMTKFYLSENIGVFISTKWGQDYGEIALKLKKKYNNKNFYFFIGDNFNPYEMENFPDMDCWVNTACPRIGQDDIINFNKSVVNIKDIY